MSAGSAITIRPLGDSALIVELEQASSRSSDVVDELLHIRHLLQEARIPGVTEVTTAMATLALFYDPGSVTAENELIFDALECQVRAALAHSARTPTRAPVAGTRLVELPVCYDAEFALDVAEVAAHAGIDPAEVIRLHSAAEYRVAAVGFTPGFPYLIGLPPTLATPRRATPRTTVPTGSVGVGGTQTGIYPMSSPGGWQIIGRTPLRLFDPTSDAPALLRAGDRVRFRAITLEEFRLAASDRDRATVQASANK